MGPAAGLAASSLFATPTGLAWKTAGFRNGLIKVSSASADRAPTKRNGASSSLTLDPVPNSEEATAVGITTNFFVPAS